jgi:signal transduction histidine kinase
LPEEQREYLEIVRSSADSLLSLINDILDLLKKEQPRIYKMILYVEQPFPYELEEKQN